MTAPITNGEAGSSVRTKLNTTIAKADTALQAVAATDITDSTATGQAAITAADAAALRDAAGATTGVFPAASMALAAPDAAGSWEREVFNAQLSTRSTANLAQLYAKIWDMRTDDLKFYDNGIQPSASEKQMMVVVTGDSYGFKMTNPLTQSLVRNLTGQKTYRLTQLGPQGARDGALIRNDGDYNYSAGVTHYVKNTGGVNGRVATPDYGLWLSGAYWSIPSGETLDFYLQGDNLFDATKIKIYAVQESGGGTYKVQLSTTAVASGYADEITGITTDGATDAKITTISKTAGSYAVRVTATSGTVKILGCLAYRDDIPQVIISDWSVGSLTPSTSFGAVNDSIMATILADIDPDLFTFGFADNGNEQPDAMGDLNGWLTTAAISPTVLTLGPNPNTLGPNAVLKATNDAMAAKAQDYDWLFFGQFYQFGEDFANMTAAELGDGTSSHPSYMGATYLAAMFAKEAGLPSPLFGLPLPYALEDDGQTLVLPVQKQIEFRDSAGTVMARIGSQSAGTANSLTGVEAPTNLHGWQGGVSVSGSGPARLRPSSAPWSAASQDFSFRFVGRFVSAGSNNQGNYMIWGGNNSIDLTNPTYGIQIQQNTLTYNGLNLRLSDGTATRNIQLDNQFDESMWHDWVITYEHSTGDVSLYVDGALVLIDSGDPKVWHNGAMQIPTWFNDNLSDLRPLSADCYATEIYDVTLTAADVANMYAAPRYIHPDAVISYRFKEGYGLTATDVATAGLNGTFDAAGLTWLEPRYIATATIDFASLAADASATDTITVTGAATGDTVLLQPQQIGGVSLYGHVSSADTVTVTAINHSAGAIDPASTSIRATVIKQ